jgi:hypothetical protein
MTDARLVVDPSSLLLRASGPATGDIVLILGSVVFPIAGWNDFVIVILDAWISALVRLVRDTSESERVHFMEGPYAVDITRLENGAFRLCAIERPNRKRALVEVRPLPVVESSITAAEAVLQVCRDAAYRSRDVEQLKAAVSTLRKETLTLTN